MTNLISTRGNYPSTLSLTRTTRNISSAPTMVIKNNVKASIFDVIGNTPMVRLNHAEKLLRDLNLEETKILCNINVKLEYLNPGGSIKDRIGRSMMEEARRAKMLHKGGFLLEASSGNTGTAVAMNAALAAANDECAGCYIVTNEKCSDEKIAAMSLLGANICLIKTGDSETAVVDQAQNSSPDKSIILDQFDNQLNPQTHFQETAEEIYKDLGKWPDMITLVAGSGGHFTGIATRVKQENPDCKVVAGDPDGSYMFHPNPHPHSFLVEGLTGGEAPINLDVLLKDECQVVTDKEAFVTARNLAKYEGILCGGSSGLAVAAALKSIIQNKNTINVPDNDVVVVLPDGIRNYMTKFVLDQWMEAQFFKEIPELQPEWYNFKITDDDDNKFVNLLKRHPCLFIEDITIARDAMLEINSTGNDVAAITYDKKCGKYKGVYPMVGLASSNSFRYHLTNPPRKPYKLPDNEDDVLNNHKVTHFMEKDMYVVKLLPPSMPNLPTVGLLSRMLDINQYVVLGYEHIDPKCDSHYAKFYGMYVATANDVLTFIEALGSRKEPDDAPSPK